MALVALCGHEGQEDYMGLVLSEMRQVCLCSSMCIYVYTHTHTYIYTSVYMYVCVCVCVCVYVYISRRSHGVGTQ